MANSCLYPKVFVRLSNTNGNAEAIISTVSQAMRRKEVTADKIAEFRTEARSGDYDNVLITCMKWVNVS